MTWLQDGGRQIDNWYDAQNWVDSLVYQNYDDWRLLRTLPVNSSYYVYGFSYDGSTDEGFNIVSPNSELAHMYNMNLGNLGYYDTDGNPQSGWGLSNTGPFLNLKPSLYWSGTH